MANRPSEGPVSGRNTMMSIELLGATVWVTSIPWYFGEDEPVFVQADTCGGIAWESNRLARAVSPPSRTEATGENDV